MFGSTGRFSQDIDLDAAHRNGFEAAIERAFAAHDPYYGICFAMPNFRYSSDENFSGTVRYEHDDAAGAFELQISYRLEPILEPRALTLVPQGYFARAECGVPALFGLDPYEMIGEKLMACNRRLGGSAKDVYDLYLWSQRPFDSELVRRLAVLKAWTDRRTSPASSLNRSSRGSSQQTSVGRTLSNSSRAACPPIARRSAAPSASASRSSLPTPRRRRYSRTKRLTARPNYSIGCALTRKAARHRWRDRAQLARADSGPAAE